MLELLIIGPDDAIVARTTVAAGSAADYRLAAVADVPPFPETDPGKGKMWELAMQDGTLVWVAVNRPLTSEERIEALEQREYAWRENEDVVPGDRRFFNGHWYVVINQPHTTQWNWNPERTLNIMWRLDD